MGVLTIVLVGGAAVVAAGAPLAWRTWRSEKAVARRRGRGSDGRTIADLAGADLAVAATANAGPAGGVPIKLVGQVVLGFVPLSAPLTGRRCVAWQVHIEREDAEAGWVTVIEERQASDFSLCDGTGSVHLRIYRPSLALADAARFQSGPLEEASPRAEIFLAARASASAGHLGAGEPMRYREGVLVEGELVAVGGVAAREPFADPGAAGSFPETALRLVMQPLPGGELIISDDPSRVADAWPGQRPPV